MEEPGGTGSQSVASPQAGAPKSKLDTLSKDDLIKFAKKQIAAMQKMKTKCTDLEKEVQTFKQSKASSSNAVDPNLLQELTERMEALLLEKAECQQRLVLSCKDLERTKKQTKDDLDQLQGQLDSQKEDHQRQLETLQGSIEELNENHQKEVAQLQNLLTDYYKPNCSDSSRPSEEVQPCLQDQLKTLVAEMEAARHSQEHFQKELALAHQDVENFREELTQQGARHQEEMKALEEDCEMERERLLLLHDELTEQLALKDTYLQDVQEEDEEPIRGSGIARMLELSGCSQAESDVAEGEATDVCRLKGVLEDVQAQNTMLHDELTLLTNLKGELEMELERIREEFQAEKEELEFKIDELQMTRESVHIEQSTTSEDLNSKVVPDSGVHETVKELETNNTADVLDGHSLPSASEVQLYASLARPEDQRLLSLDDLNQESKEKKHNRIEELEAKLEALSHERNTAIDEYVQIKDILQGLENELGQRTANFVAQYETMKEQGAKAVQDLQCQIKELQQEKTILVVSAREATEDNESLKKSLNELQMQLEEQLVTKQPMEDCVVPPQNSVLEETRLAFELKESLEELTKQNEVIVVQLQAKDNEVHELREIVGDLTAKRDGLQSQVHILEEQLDMFVTERTKEIQWIQEEKENKLESLSVEMESLGKAKNAEIEHLTEEKAKIEVNLKAEIMERQEMLSSLELAVQGFSTERDNLKCKLEEASSALSCAQDERNLLDSELTALKSELEQKEADLQARLQSLAEEAEQSRAAMTVLQKSHAEASRHSAERKQELQNRIEELEREQSMAMKTDEASGEDGLKESREGLQIRIEDLEKERDMLKSNLVEVVRDTEGLQKDLEEMKYANEKMSEENQKLYAHISDEAIEDMNTQRRQLEEQLEEKNSLVTKLCEDMAALKESAAQSTSCEENFAEKIALLETEAKEKNEKMNKIKAVAIKAKKELDTSKKEVSTLKEEVDLLKAERDKVSSSMKDVIHTAESYNNVQIDHDRLTEQLDKEREKAEGAERRMAELTKQLDAAVSQNATVSGEKEDLLAAVLTWRNTVKQLEAHVKEAGKQREGLEAELLAERLMKEQKVKELLSATSKSEELTAELGRLQQLSQQTAHELQQLRKEAQQNSLLGMEMADYERLVKELNIKVSQGESDIAQLKAQIATHVQSEESFKQQTEDLKSQVRQREEKASKMKQLLVKTKKDLAEAKNQNASSMMLQASLKGELEKNQQQLECCKIEVSELMAERHRLQEQLRCATEQNLRTASSLQQRITNLQQECEVSKAELVSTTGDFESYKVRVHNVLKQQKNKATLQSDSEPVKLEREQLSSQVEQLRARLSESQQSLQGCAAELQQLQHEHDTLLERHNKMLQETVAKEAELRERLLSVQSENMSLRTEQAQAQAELQAQAEAQRLAFREQVRHLQDEQRSTVETLHAQLSRLEEQLFTLQSQSGSPSIQSSRRPRMSDLQRRNPDLSHGGPGSIDLQTTAREEGEGMETAETENPLQPHPPLPSLELLLGSPDPKQEPFVWTVEPTKQELSQQLTTAARSMEHMNSLLHETEATNAVLMEQVTLLKSELRRLERNLERDKSVSNMEYLKNVLLQFIFLNSGTERQALLPVIHTMLQLSPEEKSRLAAIAQGQPDVSGSRGAGWSSYLHSWSGIR
ncbi:GRIP and coiled-coil domain-containing protein 2 [Gadus morhua]|uniref:GRIP and coiled-coil domain-containing protein 2 n=1 Tax=Gadus morhua TaxID=8049 RepID=UPI0011B597F8|nr:GRIP and coiled-coil domain-containing protein 2 [Gadus morhua]